jgi:hypothetical protein
MRHQIVLHNSTSIVIEQDIKARSACTRSDIICHDNSLFINLSPDIAYFCRRGKFPKDDNINCYFLRRCAGLVLTKVSDPVA